MLKDTWDGAPDPLVALRAGRSGPFEAFVRAESATFLRYFARHGASRSEAEDLVQETFLKLFRTTVPSNAGDGPSVADAAERPRYDARGQFRGFAFRVARNVWIDFARRSAWDRPLASREPEERAEPRPDPRAERPEQGAIREESSLRIREAVSGLPESHRLVFQLAVVEELPYADIAAALEIPLGTVKSRMHTAVQRVRSALEEKDRVQEAIQSRSSTRGGAPR